MQNENICPYYPPPVKFWRTLFGLLGLLVGLGLLTVIEWVSSFRRKRI